MLKFLPFEGLIRSKQRCPYNPALFSRFHAYAVIAEVDSYQADESTEEEVNRANILLRKKSYGGVPPGAGMREDVIRLFEEQEEARNNLSQIQALIRGMPDQKEKSGN